MKYTDLKSNTRLFILFAVFAAAWAIPFDSSLFMTAVQESFLMLQEYAREHVLLCLVPAFFIAGAVMVFLKQQSVIRYFGPDAPKLTAYSVASVSGAILAVCSCTVLPLFKGIYKKGAGIGPAVSFLYSGPAINILAVILTAKVLGWQLGAARAAGAVIFAFLIGYLMHLIFRKDDNSRNTDAGMFNGGANEKSGTLNRNASLIFTMAAVLVFLNWADSGGTFPLWDNVFRFKYAITAFFAIALVLMLWKWFKSDELTDWVSSSKDFALQTVPLLFAGVLAAGFLLGRPGHRALIPAEFIAGFVGGNSIASNLIAAVSGAFMYFATLTEVPIMQGLIGAGMGKGPALALLLAGPSLSLPSMFVISGELGIKKTLVYVFLVILLSAAAGKIYGIYF